jgi:hypothetical protein
VQLLPHCLIDWCAVLTAVRPHTCGPRSWCTKLQTWVVKHHWALVESQSQGGASAIIFVAHVSAAAPSQKGSWCRGCRFRCAAATVHWF